MVSEGNLKGGVIVAIAVRGQAQQKLIPRDTDESICLKWQRETRRKVRRAEDVERDWKSPTDGGRIGGLLGHSECDGALMTKSRAPGS